MLLFFVRQRPTLPGSYPPSTIGAGGLNGRVRYGNGWNPSAFATGPGYHSLKTAQCISLKLIDQAFDLLVPVSFDITAFTLPAYQPDHLSGILFHFWMGNLILRLVSRLDAFSASPFQTWLPNYATGVTIGTPEVCPLRSSRTKSRSSQISCARDG